VRVVNGSTLQRADGGRSLVAQIGRAGDSDSKQWQLIEPEGRGQLIEGKLPQRNFQHVAYSSASGLFGATGATATR